MPTQATLFEAVCLLVIIGEMVLLLALWQAYHKVASWATTVSTQGTHWLLQLRQAQRQVEGTRQSVEAVMPFVYTKLLPLDVMLGVKQGFLAGWASAQAKR
jgi:hypothetical protein